MELKWIFIGLSVWGASQYCLVFFKFNNGAHNTAAEVLLYQTLILNPLLHYYEKYT